MKSKLTIIICFLSLFAYAQTDSTRITIESISDPDTRLLNSLNQIQLLKISCADSQMIGKRFFLSIDEYRNGIKISTDSLGLKCKNLSFPISIGKDTMYYQHNTCNGISFNETCLQEKFTIRIAGKLEKDTINMRIHYPGIQLNFKLSGGPQYLLREINRNPNLPQVIRLNQNVPIISYSPPFETDAGLNSYCLMTNEPIENWFEKFNVPHFYIIQLRIN